MLKTIVGIILIISAIIFIYPIENMIMPTGIRLFSNNRTDGELIKGFGKVKVENYEKYEKIGTDAFSKCYAIYLMKNKQMLLKNRLIVMKTGQEKHLTKNSLTTIKSLM